MMGARVGLVTLPSGGAVAGQRGTTWEGRDDTGRLVSSDTYFNRLETTIGEEVRRVTLSRGARCPGAPDPT